MSFDEGTQTMSVGSQDWLEASKNWQIRSYLPPVGDIEIAAGSVEQAIQLTATGYQIPVPMSREYESARLTEELNEVYDGEMEEEEKQITQHVKEYHRRRLSAG
jgi:hypothetical protein